MKYFKIQGGVWVESEYNPDMDHIIVYESINGVITPIGIGQY